MLPEQQQSWLQSEVNSEEFTCAQKGVDGVHSHGREMLCVLSPAVVSMALRGQAVHPVTAVSASDCAQLLWEQAGVRPTGE